MTPLTKTLLQRLDAKANDPQADATSRELHKAAAAEIERLRLRAVVGENRNLLERLGKSSLSEAIEDTLRTKLAEAELALAAMTAEVDALMRHLFPSGVPTEYPWHQTLRMVLDGAEVAHQQHLQEAAERVQIAESKVAALHAQIVATAWVRAETPERT